MMDSLSGKTILITGGTGSFGMKMSKVVLEKYPDVQKIIIFSRDEFKQFDMANQDFYREHEKKFRFFIGDIRDFKRLCMAFNDVDIVIHAAALKQVPIAEYNPFECIKTNVLGAQNIIEAAFRCNVKKVIALSTDKAVSPINLYGATKLCSDKLFVAANNIRGAKDISFSVVRYGNVFGSRGSVVPYFVEKSKTGVLPITDERMTRFNITLDEGVKLVINSIFHSKGGEIFIPKIPSYKIMDLANAISPDSKKEIVGIRPGEKLHEEMISVADSFYTYDFQDFYIIYPNFDSISDENPVIDGVEGKKVPEGFRYSSDQNENWMTTQQIQDLLKQT